MVHYNGNGSHEEMKFDEAAPRAPVGCPERHMMAMEQATGAAVFADDNPLGSGGLYAAYVSSTIARGRIKRVDPATALAMEGVHRCFIPLDVSCLLVAIGSTFMSTFSSGASFAGTTICVTSRRMRRIFGTCR